MSDLPPAARSAVGATIVAWLLFVLTTLSVVLVPIRSDNDCWWHVKSGQYLTMHGIPENDVLNYNALSMPWHNHEWLAQVLFYNVWNLGNESQGSGWPALISFVGLCILASYAILFWAARRLSGSVWIALAIALFAVAVGRRTFYPRPPVISYLLMMALIAFLIAYDEKWIVRRRWLAILPPGFALWSNLHGGWMAGVVVLGCWTVQDALRWCGAWIERRRRGSASEPELLLPPAKWMALLAAVFLGTIANPYTWHLYELPKRVMSDLALVRSIGELRSPDMYFVLHFEGVVLATIVLAVFARGFRPRIAEVLLYVFFLHQAIQHVRHLTLFSFAMLPLLARLAGAARANASQWLTDRDLRVPGASLVGGIACAAVAFVLLQNPREGVPYPIRNIQLLGGAPEGLSYGFGTTRPVEDLSIGYDRRAFPAAACDFIELAKPPGRMFNANSYAGYLIWRFSPESYTVFADPRFDIFGGKFLAIEQAIEAGYDEPGAAREGRRQVWEQLLDEYEVQWALLRGSSGLSARMMAKEGVSRWRLVGAFPDSPDLYGSGWHVWIRETPENAEAIERALAVARGIGALSL